MAATGSSELLREATRGFLAREAPLSAVRAGLERPRTLDRAAWARAAAMGWIAALLPEEHGGLGSRPDERGHDRRGAGPRRCTAARSSAARWRRRRGRRSRGSRTARRRPRGASWRVATAPRRRRARLRRGAPRVRRGRRGRARRRCERRRVPRRGGRRARRGRRRPRPHANALHRHARRRARHAASPPPTRARSGALLAAADAVGVAARLLEMTVEYAKQRTTFGRTLASYQAVKHKCADMLCWVEGSRTAVAAAAATGEPCDRRREGVRDRALRARRRRGAADPWRHRVHVGARPAPVPTPGKADEAMFPRAFADLVSG